MIVDTDEHIRPGVTPDDLARLRPAFAQDGTVTAGNASGVNDAAAAVLLAGEDFAERHAADPLGRLVVRGLGLDWASCNASTGPASAAVALRLDRKIPLYLRRAVVAQLRRWMAAVARTLRQQP